MSHSILQKFNCVFFDLDGVLRIGKQIVPGANEILKYLKINNIPYLICTNECRYSNKELRNELISIGLTECNSCPIYTAGNSICDYFEKLNYNDMLDEKHKDYYIGVVGENGLKDTLNQYSKTRDNIHLINQSLSGLNKFNEDIKTAKHKYLVIGTLTKFRIEEIEKCYQWITAGAKVLLTCPDSSEPSSRGDFDIILPKHIIHILKYNLNFEYESIGKPHIIVEENMNSYYQNKIKEKNKVLFIGDTLITDMELANKAGWSKCLVLSGNTNKEMAKSYLHKIDYIVKNVKELLPNE